MPILNYDSLIKYLDQEGYQPTFQNESSQIYIVIDLLGHEVPVFIAILGEGVLLQTVAYLPYTINEKNFNEVARLLHHLNRELDMPGFGMDETDKLVFYRTVTPSLNHEFNEELLKMYLNVTRAAGETFMQIIGAVKEEKNENGENKNG